MPHVLHRPVTRLRLRRPTQVGLYTLATIPAAWTIGQFRPGPRNGTNSQLLLGQDGRQDGRQGGREAGRQAGREGREGREGEDGRMGGREVGWEGGGQEAARYVSKQAAR